MQRLCALSLPRRLPCFIISLLCVVVLISHKILLNRSLRNKQAVHPFGSSVLRVDTSQRIVTQPLNASNGVQQIPWRASTSTPGPVIRLETFLYMVLGEGYPEQRWLNRAYWPSVSLLFMSWKVDVSKELPQQLLQHSQFRYVYYPKSTWSTARNRMAELGHTWEGDQGWRFEFFVFFDEDVLLVHRLPDNPGMIVANFSDDSASLRQLNKVLIRDRPMKAGLGFNEFGWNKHNFQCLQRCQADNLVMAYHATASSFIQPYSTHFDASNWWLSAYMLNMVTSAVAPEFCANYVEVLVDRKTQKHNLGYPRSMDMWKDAVAHIGQCLANASFSGFSLQLSTESLTRRLQTSLSREPRGPPPCTTSPTGVDFAALLGARLEHFPKNC